MHESAVKAIVLWYASHFGQVHDRRIADLGALNINGSITDFLPEKTIGFDLCQGRNVDIIIAPGCVPTDQLWSFDAVIAANSFHYSTKPELFRKEVLDLLKVGGLFCLTMCRPDCAIKHSLPVNNQYNFEDGLRMTEDELRTFWSDVLKIERTYIEGHDLVLWGQK